MLTCFLSKKYWANYRKARLYISSIQFVVKFRFQKLFLMYFCQQKIFSKTTETFHFEAFDGFKLNFQPIVLSGFLYTVDEFEFCLFQNTQQNKILAIFLNFYSEIVFKKTLKQMTNIIAETAKNVNERIKAVLLLRFKLLQGRKFKDFQRIPGEFLRRIIYANIQN